MIDVYGIKYCVYGRLPLNLLSSSRLSKWIILPLPHLPHEGRLADTISVDIVIYQSSVVKNSGFAPYQSQVFRLVDDAWLLYLENRDDNNTFLTRFL